MKKLIFSGFFVFTLFLPAIAQQPLFPTPVKMKNERGSFLLGNNLKASGNSGYADLIANQFQSEQKKINLSGKMTSGNIHFELDAKFAIVDEGYILRITPDSVLLQAATEAGLFYGKESLLQLVRFGKGTIGCCQIEDAPRYPWRGFMLDESRHFFGIKKVKQYLDIMASLKLNIFHWHLTDQTGWRIEIKQYPKLTVEGSIGNWRS